jgi:hypothetical protein
LCIPAGNLGIPWNPAVPAFQKKGTTFLFGRNAQKKLDRLQRNHQKHVPFCPNVKIRPSWDF